MDWTVIQEPHTHKMESSEVQVRGKKRLKLILSQRNNNKVIVQVNVMAVVVASS